MQTRILQNKVKDLNEKDKQRQRDATQESFVKMEQAADLARSTVALSQYKDNATLTQAYKAHLAVLNKAEKADKAAERQAKAKAKGKAMGKAKGKGKGKAVQEDEDPRDDVQQAEEAPLDEPKEVEKNPTVEEEEEAPLDEPKGDEKNPTVEEEEEEAPLDEPKDDENDQNFNEMS